MMPTLMKQSVLACVIVFCFLSTGRTQAVINVKTGVESWTIQDELNASGMSSHPGQFFGFDVYVEKNRALFVPGFHYHRISVENEEDRFNYNFSEAHHIHYFTIPLTGGYKFLDQRNWNISAMAGGEITFFYDLDGNDIGLDDDMFYGVWTGLTGVLQAEIFSIVTTEVKYHYGLQPIIKTRDDSKLSGWTMALGVKF